MMTTTGLIYTPPVVKSSEMLFQNIVCPKNENNSFFVNELPRSRAAKYQRGLKAILYWKGTRRFPFQTNPFLVIHPAAELRGILLIKTKRKLATDTPRQFFFLPATLSGGKTACLSGNTV